MGPIPDEAIYGAMYTLVGIGVAIGVGSAILCAGGVWLISACV